MRRISLVIILFLISSCVAHNKKEVIETKVNADSLIGVHERDSAKHLVDSITKAVRIQFIADSVKESLQAQYKKTHPDTSFYTQLINEYFDASQKEIFYMKKQHALSLGDPQFNDILKKRSYWQNVSENIQAKIEWGRSHGRLSEEEENLYQKDLAWCRTQYGL